MLFKIILTVVQTLKNSFYFSQNQLNGPYHVRELVWRSLTDRFVRG